MQRMLLGIGLILILSTNSIAFSSGTYECLVLGKMPVIYILKENGRAKMKIFNTTTRGTWINDDDAAIISIKDETIIEKNGNNYGNALMSCHKTK